MIQNVERGPHRHQRIDEGQRDPDDEREILLSKRLAGFLPVTAPAEQRTHAKIDDANDQRDQGNDHQRGNGIGIFIAQKIRGIGADDKKIDQPDGKRKRFSLADEFLCPWWTERETSRARINGTNMTTRQVVKLPRPRFEPPRRAKKATPVG